MTNPQQSRHLAPGTWIIDPTRSSIEIDTLRPGLGYANGCFGLFSGTLTVDERDVLESKIELSIDASSLRLYPVVLDQLMGSEDSLQSREYPTINFTSTRIQQVRLNRFLVSGDLTVRNITREVQVPLAFGGLVKTSMGARAGFSGELRVSRKELGLPGGGELEDGRNAAEDVIKIGLRIELVSPPPESA